MSGYGFSKSAVWKLTFSTANVLITYSASSSVSIKVTLMSLYISVSSGQYLQHLTFRKHKGNKGFRVCFSGPQTMGHSMTYRIKSAWKPEVKLYTTEQGLFS